MEWLNISAMKSTSMNFMNILLFDLRIWASSILKQIDFLIWKFWTCSRTIYKRFKTFLNLVKNFISILIEYAKLIHLKN